MTTATARLLANSRGPVLDGDMQVADDLRQALTSNHALLKLPPFERCLVRIEELGVLVREQGPGNRAAAFRCPLHDDRNASGTLGVNEDGKVLIRCFAECDSGAVVEALGLEWGMLFVNGGGSARRRAESLRRQEQVGRRNLALNQDIARIAELVEHEGWAETVLDDFTVGRNGEYLSYPERDGRGRVVGIGNYLPRNRREPGKRKHTVEKGDERGLIYRAGGISPGSRVLIVEGFPCTMAAATLFAHDVIGFPSVSHTGAASWWRSLISGCDCIVFPDPDEPGVDAGEKVAQTIRPYAASVAVVPTLSLEFRFNSLPGDIAEVLRKHGADKATDQITYAIEKARTLPKPKRGRPASQREKTKSYLRTVLADGEWHESKPVTDSRPAGVSERTLKSGREVAWTPVPR